MADEMRQKALDFPPHGINMCGPLYIFFITLRYYFSTIIYYSEVDLVAPSFIQSVQSCFSQKKENRDCLTFDVKDERVIETDLEKNL